MIVAFWNIEKAIKPNNQTDAVNAPLNYNGREGAVQAVLNKWPIREGRSFDLLIIAEIPSIGGDAFIQRTVGELNQSPRQQVTYEGSFFDAPRNNGDRSNCCLGAIWNSTHPFLKTAKLFIKASWDPDWVRPMVLVPTGEYVIAGMHAKSGMKQQASTEIYSALVQLAGYEQAGFLLGDMNIKFESIDPSDISSLGGSKGGGLGWRPVRSGLPITHRSKSAKHKPAVLDYAWKKTLRCDAIPPFHDYDSWQFVDHCPIQYDIGWDNYSFENNVAISMEDRIRNLEAELQTYKNNNNNNNNNNGGGDGGDDPDLPPIPPYLSQSTSTLIISPVNSGGTDSGERDRIPRPRPITVPR